MTTQFWNRSTRTQTKSQIKSHTHTHTRLTPPMQPCLKALHPNLEPEFDKFPGSFRVPEVAGTYKIASPRVLYLTFDARILGDARETLASLIRSPDAVTASGCVQVAQSVMTLLMMLLHVMAHPSLGRADDIEAEITNADQYLKRDSGYIPRVDMYHEVLKTNPDADEYLTPEVVVGHRIALVFLDKGLDPNTGIETLIASNAGAKKKVPVPGEPEEHPAYKLIRSIKSKSFYVNGVVCGVVPGVRPTLFTYGARLDDDLNEVRLRHMLDFPPPCSRTIHFPRDTRLPPTLLQKESLPPSSTATPLSPD